jgi:two-component system, chemotaxis family, sensor kinase CheA
MWDIDRDALLPIFLAEAEEGFASMEECLVALETRPHDAELLGELFRAAHTLKGNSASLGFTSVAEFLHVLEDLLDRVRHGAAALDQRLVTLLLESVDLLRDRVAREVAGDDTPSPRQVLLLAALTRAAAAGAEPAGDAEAAALPDDALLSRPESARARGLRIGIEKLDRLLAASGEIAIARGRIGSLLYDGHVGRGSADRPHQDRARAARRDRSRPGDAAHGRPHVPARAHG